MATALDTPVRLDGIHTVLTPEYVEFNFVLAGLMSRFLALIVDTVLSLIITVALSILVFLFSLLLSLGGAAVGGKGLGDQLFGLGFSSAFVIWFLIDWGYMVLLEVAWNGQTVGKKMMGLRVIQDTGVRVGVYQSLLRNLVRPLDKLPILYLVGGTAALFSGSQQRLGDLLAGTIVVRERRLKIPAQLERPDGDTSLLADPDFRARVDKLSAEEETVLFSAESFATRARKSGSASSEVSPSGRSSCAGILRRRSRTTMVPARRSPRRCCFSEKRTEIPPTR